MAPRTRSGASTPVPSQPHSPEVSVSVSSASTTTATQPQGTPTATQRSSRPRTGSRTRTLEDVYDAKYAVDLATTTVDENVFLFVPNLIGYTRVILAAGALYYMPKHPVSCTVLYTISCLLDALDGHAARLLGQTSKFGAVLDMVTDRCTTACLLCYLAIDYPKFQLLFMFLITLDFSSHYMHMYSSLVTGSSSHKKVTSDVSRILWLYYDSQVVLFFFCFVNEMCFVCLYLARHWPTPIFADPQLPAFFRALLGAHPKLLFHAEDILRRLSWPQLVGFLSLGPCAMKQVINVVQFWKASKILVGVDLAERQAQREAAAIKKARK